MNEHIKFLKKRATWPDWESQEVKCAFVRRKDIQGYVMVSGGFSQCPSVISM
jgi:hypothetical protein